MKVKKIPVEIYSYNVFFHMDRESYEDATNTNGFNFVCSVRGQTVRILVSNLWGSATDPRFLQCLSHECNHAAMTILDRVL